MAIAVGAYMLNSVGSGSVTGEFSFGRISVLNFYVAVTQSDFSNCLASSLTGISQGSSSVYGGAFAVLHSPQVSNLKLGLLQPLSPFAELNATGFNLTILISNSNFSRCSAISTASSVLPGKANGGGGAMYAKSVAMTNFSVTMSTFINNIVKVASGTTGLSSFSSGGALAVAALEATFSVVSITRSSFVNCTAAGVRISNLAVRGGALHVSRASSVSVIRTNFTNCSVTKTADGDVVSGGAAVSTTLTRNVFIDECIFDATGGQDKSGTSAGLLVLARNSSSSWVSVSQSKFTASAVAFSVQCVSDDGARPVGGFCVGPHLLLKHSALHQVASQAADFSAAGSVLMSLQNPESVSFAGSQMHCANAEFSAFMLQHDIPSMFGTEYSCRPCQTFNISLSAHTVSLEQLSFARNVSGCIPISEEFPILECPYAIQKCTTFVRVSQGFWTTFSESGKLEPAQRCPRGYCTCGATNGSCLLPPPLSIDRNPDALCSGNRTGKLCGGCAPNFTQSMDDRSCISNETCAKNLWWVWTLSVLGYAAFSLYIVVSCGQWQSGAFSCLLFYFQMSSFAVSVDESNASSTILEYAQVRSIVALYEGACYARSTGAYDATVFKLVGPLLVLLFVLAWTWIIQKLQPRLKQRGIYISASYSGSIAVTVLYMFSSVANVVFTLAECSSYRDDANAVVFIDGTVPCRDAKWTVVVFFAALLFLVPPLFAAALRLKKLPQSARDSVCGKFHESVSYWGAVTLSFRLLVSVSQFLEVDFPNLLAFVRSFLSTGVMILLVYLRPYVDEGTFWVDVVCYVCLIAQFGLQGFTANRAYLAVFESLNQRSFFRSVSTLSTVAR